MYVSLDSSVPINPLIANFKILSQLVQTQMESSDLVLDTSAPLNYTALATQTEGYSVTDLKDLVSRAIHRAVIRSTDLNEATDRQVSPAVAHLYG